MELQMKFLFALLFCLIAHCTLASTPVKNSEPLGRLMIAKQPVEINDKYHHVVDIGFFYTEDLLKAIGRKGIDQYITAQINAANQVLENSELNIRRRAAYVGLYPVDNQPNAAINDFLSSVYSMQAYDHMLAKSRQFGLDYMTILRPHTDLNYCGWAYYDNPFAIMEVGGGCTSDTLGAHEWGHNDGADHDIVNSSDTPITEYARGYNCNGQGTIMSTSNDWHSRHEFYSSPNVVIEGEACGKDNEADFVRVLNELVDKPNHLGNRAVTPEILGAVQVTSDVAYASEGEAVELTITLKSLTGEIEALDREVSVEVYSYSETATVGNDFIELTQRVVFEAGETQKTVMLQILNDNEHEPLEYVKVELRYAEHLSVLESLVVIEISDVLGSDSLRFVKERVSISDKQTLSLEVVRQADFAVPITVSLATDSNTLNIESPLLAFMSSNESQFFKLTSEPVNQIEYATIKLTNLDGSEVYDELIVRIVPNSLRKSGGSIAGLILVLFCLVRLRCASYK